MPQVVSGFTVPAGSDAISTIDDTMATMAGELSSKFSTFTRNTQTGTSYALALTDAGDLVTLSNASAVSVTIPLEASVAWAANTVITLANLGAGTVTVSCAGGTLNGSNLTLSTNEAGSLIKTGTNTWLMTKGGGLPKASVSSSTGAPTTTANGSRTSYRWAGSGTVTLTEGMLEVLIVGGGGGSGAGAPGGGDPGRGTGGGGGGGAVVSQTIYVAAGTYTLSVGAGGAAQNVGIGSAFSPILYAPGGGFGRNGAEGAGSDGGSGGGAGGNTTAANGGNTISNFWGFSGGANGSNQRGGGGGGSSAVGATGVSGGAGGAGTSKTIVNGSAVTYAAGGSSLAFGTSTAGTAGTANTGNGAGGGAADASNGGAGAAGGSGVIVLLIG